MIGPTGESYHVRHDWADDRSLVTTIVTKVAEVTDTPVEQLPMLYRVISPEALEMILDPGATISTERPTTVTFEYYGQTVSVDSEGAITVSNRDP